MTLSAVLFDMDGLLVDTEPIWQRAEDRAVAELGGTEWTPEDQRAVLGASLPLAGEYMRRRTGTSRSGDEVAQLIIGGFLDDVRAGSPIVVQPGAVELVNEVAGAGIPFALVSASVRARRWRWVKERGVMVTARRRNSCRRPRPSGRRAGSCRPRTS